MKRVSYRIGRQLISVVILCTMLTAMIACSDTDKSQIEQSATSGISLKPIELPPPQTDGGKPLMQVLKVRKSIRSYSSKKLPNQVLSNLLWAAFGINRPNSGKRTAPSAVNWQEVDIYVCLEEGLYLYHAKAHKLNPILSGDIRAKTTRSLQPVRESIEKAPVTFIYVADSAKTGMTGRLIGAADRDMFAAAGTGYISQNVYLFCASEGLGTVVRGLVDRPLLRKVMKLRSKQKIILAQSIGYPAKKVESKTGLDLSLVDDGTYKSDFTLEDVVYGVEVVVKEKRIADVTIHNIKDTDYETEANLIINGIIRAQSTDIDAISGATAGIEVLLMAVERAILPENFQ